MLISFKYVWSFSGHQALMGWISKSSMVDLFMYCFSVVLLCWGTTNLRLPFHYCGYVIFISGWNSLLFTKKESSLQNVIPCRWCKGKNSFHALFFEYLCYWVWANIGIQCDLSLLHRPSFHILTWVVIDRLLV